MKVTSVPIPRSGVLGAWDRLVGPGMTTSETTLVLAASALGSVLAGGLMAASGSAPWRVGLAALIGLDVFGGAVCNATWTTRGWYHRRGQTWVQHLSFMLPHLAYVIIVAAFLRGRTFDYTYALVFGVGLIGAMAAILCAPARLKAPIAFFGYLALMCAVMFGVGSTPSMVWFEPALMLKLLLGHLIPNATGDENVA